MKPPGLVFDNFLELYVVAVLDLAVFVSKYHFKTSDAVDASSAHSFSKRDCVRKIRNQKG